jgi:hypothetical protein
MSVIDFANSYMSGFGPDRSDGARIQIDAACTIHGDDSAPDSTFYLIAPCRTEDMYDDDHIFKIPSADWRGIWAADERVILRKFWASSAEYLTRPGAEKDFGSSHGARLDIAHFDGARALSTYEDVVEAALGGAPFVCTTEIRDPRTGTRATLHYPVRTMNARTTPPRFQVDTGPMLVPDFESEAERPIERIDMAYIGYNVFDKAEFMLRRPKVVSDGDSRVTVIDYSVVQIVPARNRVFVPANV